MKLKPSAFVLPGDMMTVVRVVLLATLLGVASAFGTAPACSLATRPQMAGVALYGGQQNVRALSVSGCCLSPVCRHVSAHTHACRERMSSH